jgi:hypothetical protein
MWGCHGCNCKGDCLLGCMIWPPPCHWCNPFGFPCVLEYCIPLGTGIPGHRLCYLCNYHLLECHCCVLVWVIKICNVLSSAVDCWTILTDTCWSASWSEIHIPFLKSLWKCGIPMFPKTFAVVWPVSPFCLESMMWLLCWVTHVVEILNSFLPWATLSSVFWIVGNLFLVCSSQVSMTISDSNIILQAFLLRKWHVKFYLPVSTTWRDTVFLNFKHSLNFSSLLFMEVLITLS